MISLLYELDWKNRDVAWELGVNESRASQIKRVALTKLRAGLAGARSPEADLERLATFPAGSHPTVHEF